MGLQLQIHSDPQEILAYAILRAERALYHAQTDWTSKMETERVTHSYHKAMAAWRTSQLAQQSTPDSAMLPVTTVAAEVTQLETAILGVRILTAWAARCRLNENPIFYLSKKQN